MWFPLATCLFFLVYGPCLAFSYRVFASTKKGTSINQRPVNANNGGFWIGKPTKSLPCPAGSPESQCPADIVTAIDLSDRMYNVGITQRIYVSAGGALSFTHPKTDPLVPANAFPNDLYWKTMPSGADVLTWAPSWDKEGKTTFYACPKRGKTTGPYQIFVPEARLTMRPECKAVWLLLQYYGDYGAWEYV